MSMKDAMFREAMKSNLARDKYSAEQRDAEILNRKRKTAKKLLEHIEKIGSICRDSESGFLTASRAVHLISVEQKKARELAFGLEWNL